MLPASPALRRLHRAVPSARREPDAGDPARPRAGRAGWTSSATTRPGSASTTRPAYELIASPEVFIAAAAERTKHIRLGTGVSSLPYHHPFMLADRINQLDHMTRGRVMFGVGPGALSSDAFMMGIPIARQRDMMDEALDVIVRLLRGEEVSHETDWFELNKRAAADDAPIRAPASRSRWRARSRRPARGPPAATASACSRSAPPPTAASTRWPPTGRSPRSWRQGQRQDHGPRRLAPGRPDAHRRDPGAGDGRRPLRPGEVALLLPRDRQPADRARSRRRPGRGVPVDADWP